MVCLLHLDQWCVFSRVRVTRAPSLGFLIFCFHNLHRRGLFPSIISCFILFSWMEEFPTFWALVEHLLVMFSTCLANFVPNRAVIIWIWSSYSEFCEGCESIKLKIAVGARIRAREGILFRFHDVWSPPSFFYRYYRERFLVFLGLELLCDEAVCSMKSTNFVRLILAISCKD